MTQRSTSSFTILAIGLMLAVAAAAQETTGNLFGVVVDEQDLPIPGTTVTLTGLGADREQVTDTRGQYRFLYLDPGTYALAARLDGFSATEFPGIEIAVGRSTTVPLVLQSAVQETITVTSESPLLDERGISQGTTLPQVELEKLPTSRRISNLANQTPGVLLDVVDVGGSSSGGISTLRIRAQGVGSAQNNWLMDGFDIADGRGFSTTPLDLDQFAEVRFTTGGTDVTKATAGVEVNLVTKRGSNDFRGSARFYQTREEGYFGGLMEQAKVNVGPEDMGPGQDFEDYGGARNREIEDFGLEAGGPILRDRLWLWGSWGQNDIQRINGAGFDENQTFENTALKMNGQITRANSFVISWNNGDKVWLGRNASLNWPVPTAWDQRGPMAYYRFEDTHVVSSRLFVTGMASISDLGWELVGQAGQGPDAPESWYRSDGVWQDNYVAVDTAGDSTEFRVEVPYFFSTGSVNHELQSGGRYREYEDSQNQTWPGGRDVFTYNSPGLSLVVAKRGWQTPSVLEYTSLWAQDTITRGRWSFNVGLRYDHQSGYDEAGVTPANPMVPNVLPAIDYPGNDPGFAWDNVLPRLGVTYALGADRSTLIRGSFAQFAERLDRRHIQRTNPTGNAYAYFQVPFEDGPYTGDGSELDDPSKLFFTWGFDPSDPTALETPNRTDPDLEAQVTSELVLEVEHALLPELVVGVGLTWRHVDDISGGRDFLREPDGTVRPSTAADYVIGGRAQGTIPGGVSGGPELDYDVPLFVFAPQYEPTGGSLLANDGREREYLGGTVHFTKRLADQWMLRGYLSVGDAEWRVPDSYLQISDPNPADDGSDRDGSSFMEGGPGAGAGWRAMQSGWSAHLSGLYQVAPVRPWGFNVAASFQAREGYPVPYSYLLRPSSDFGRNKLVSVVPEVTAYRMDDVYVLDLRLEKEFNLRGPLNLVFGIDAFNVTNEGTEQARFDGVNFPRAFWLTDNISPRIYRLGVRLSWR